MLSDSVSIWRVCLRHVSSHVSWGIGKVSLLKWTLWAKNQLILVAHCNKYVQCATNINSTAQSSGSRHPLFIKDKPNCAIINFFVTLHRYEFCDSTKLSVFAWPQWLTSDWVLTRLDTGLCSDCCSLYGDPNYKLWPLVNLNEQWKLLFASRSREALLLCKITIPFISLS